MSKLHATRSDYKNAFKKHHHAFCNWHYTGSKNSQLLILCYCVECGLKYSLMQKERIYETSQLREDLKKLLGTHDIEKLIISCKLSGDFSFPHFKTLYNDDITAENFHQMCRYCIPYKPLDNIKHNEYEGQLTKIAKFLEEMI